MGFSLLDRDSAFGVRDALVPGIRVDAR